MAVQPIGPYTFGEEYNQIQEINRQKQIIYNKKKNQFTPDQVDRTRELAAMYPSAQAGLISSAVLKGLDNKEFEKLLKLQYQAVPKSQPVFPNQIGNDTYNSAMFNSTFGKVFNSIGQQFQLPEGLKFWNKSTYQGEPVYGTFKGAFRVLALLGGGIANATIGKPTRAVIKRAGDIEEKIGGPLQAIADVKRTQAGELAAQGFGEDKDKTLYDLAVARDEAAKAEKYAKYIPKLTGLLSIMAPGVAKIAGKSVTDYYKNAGPSTYGVALEKIKDGQNPGAVWKSFGEGYFPQGPIVAESLEREEAYKYRGQNITLGRYPADLVGLEQDTLLYNALSGSIDFFKVLYTDPFLVAGKISKGIKFANSLQGKIQKAYRAGEIEKIPSILDNFLNSPKSEPFLQAFVETNDFKKVFDAVRDPELALNLVKSNSIDTVKELFKNFTIKNQRLGIPAIIRSKKSIGYNKNLIEALKKPNAPYSKFGEWTPDAGAMYKDATDSVRVFNQWLVEFKLPRNIANLYATEFAEQAVAGSRTGMANILFNKLPEQVKVTMKSEGFSSKTIAKIDEYFKELQGFIKIKGTNQYDIRSYWATLGKTEGGGLAPMEKVFKGMRSIAGPDGLPIDMPTPFDIGQHFDELWSLGKPLDIRRALSTVEKYTNIDIDNTKLVNLAKNFINDLPETSRIKLPVESLLESVVPKTEMLVSFIPETISSLSDLLWPAQKIWTGAQLITRIAWPLRLFGEGQFRMGLDGLDNWIETPMSSWVWTNYYSDILGNDFRKGIMPSKRAYEEIVQGIVANRPANVFGKGTMKSFAQQSWKRILKEGTPKDNYISSWQINLRWPIESDLAKSIAKELLEGTDLSKTKQSFWNGPLRTIRNQLNDTRINFNGTPMNPFTKLNDADNYVDDYVQWIMDLTKGDEDILTLIANRTLNFQGKVITFDDFNRWTPSNQNLIKKFLSSKYDTAAPDVLPAPDWVANPQTKNKFIELANKGTQYLWYWFGEIPDAELQRIPTFTQYYWQNVATQLPFAELGAYKHFDDLIAKSKVPSAVKELYQAGKNAAIKKYGSLEEAVKNIPENMRLSIDEINDGAKMFSLEMHNRLLYNLNQKGYVAEGMRLVFPFLEPWKEIVLNYPKLFWKNKSGLRKIQLAKEQGTNNGFFYTDPTSREEYYVTAPTDLTLYVYGIEDRDLSGFEEDVQLRLSSPVKGANLFTQSPIPGVGPVMKIAYKQLKKFMPDSEWTQKVEDTIFPYGLGQKGLEGATIGEAPVYLQQLYNTKMKGDLDEMGWANDVANATKSLTVAWLKGYLPYDPRTDEGRELFEKDAIDMASRINVYEAIAKGIAISSPRAEATFKLELNERLANQEDFLDKDNLIEVLESIMPADFEFGKYDDDYFTNAVITAIFRQVLNQVEPGEEYLAYQFIASLIGETPEDWDAIYTATYLVQGNTTTLGKELPSTEEQVEWYNAYPEKAKQYENTFVLFAPNVYEFDLLDVNSFYNQVDEGQRITLTIDEKIERAQETTFRLVFNNLYRPYREALAEGKISQQDARAEAAVIKADLLEVFPLGTDARDLPKREPVSRYVIFEELKEAANDEFMLENSEQARGLNLFLYGDENNYGFMHYLDKVRNKEGLKKTTADGKVVLYPEDQALNYLGTQENTQAMRDYLFNWGAQVVEQYPDFAGIYRSKFLYIVEYQYTP
jgi:hypothetical protein